MLQHALSQEPSASENFGQFDRPKLIPLTKVRREHLSRLTDLGDILGAFNVTIKRVVASLRAWRRLGLVYSFLTKYQDLLPDPLVHCKVLLEYGRERVIRSLPIGPF